MELVNRDANDCRKSFFARARFTPPISGRQVELPRSWVTDPEKSDRMGSGTRAPYPGDIGGLSSSTRRQHVITTDEDSRSSHYADYDDWSDGSDHDWVGF